MVLWNMTFIEERVIKITHRLFSILLWPHTYFWAWYRPAERDEQMNRNENKITKT